MADLSHLGFQGSNNGFFEKPMYDFLCAFNYIIYPIFVQCYPMGRFGHENGPFWMFAGAVLILFFLPLGPFWSGPFWFQWSVFDLHWGHFGDGPFWSVPFRMAQVSITLSDL